MLDCQVTRLTKANRHRLETEIQALQDGLTGRWDPPVELAASLRSARSISVVVDGAAHEVRGTSRNDSLDRLARLVHEEVAAPRRRRVLVALTGTGGPVRLHVDPTGDARFDHDDAG
ncbi:hypothetical protein [Blastococcus sp. SYSU DS0619]